MKIPAKLIGLAVISSLACATVPAVAGVEPGVDANIFVKLSKKVVPSVVNISTLTTVKSGSSVGNQGSDPQDMFRRFFEEFFRQHGGRGRAQPPGAPGDEDDEGGPLPPT